MPAGLTLLLPLASTRAAWLKRLTHSGGMSGVDDQRGLTAAGEGAQHGISGQVDCRRPAQAPGLASLCRAQPARQAPCARACSCGEQLRALPPVMSAVPHILCEVEQRARVGLCPPARLPAWMQHNSQPPAPLSSGVQPVPGAAGAAAGSPVPLKQGLHGTLAHGRRLVGRLCEQQRVLADIRSQPVPAGAQLQRQDTLPWALLGL